MNASRIRLLNLKMRPIFVAVLGFVLFMPAFASAAPTIIVFRSAVPPINGANEQAKMLASFTRTVRSTDPDVQVIEVPLNSFESLDELERAFESKIPKGATISGVCFFGHGTSEAYYPNETTQMSGMGTAGLVSSILRMRPLTGKQLSIYFPVCELGGKCELNKNFQDSFIEGLEFNFAISDKQNKITPEKLEVVAHRYQTTQLAYSLLPTLELPARIVEPIVYKAKAYAPYVAVLGSGVLATPLAIYLSQISNAAWLIPAVGVAGGVGLFGRTRSVIWNRKDGTKSEIFGFAKTAISAAAQNCREAYHSLGHTQK